MDSVQENAHPANNQHESPAPSEPVSRREALRQGRKLVIAAVPGSLVMLGGAEQSAAQDAGPSVLVLNALNLALTLEYATADFYGAALAASDLIPAGAPRSIVELLMRHEEQHVAVLEGLLGENADPKPPFDFSAGGQIDPLNDYSDFLLLAQAFEDFSVRLYGGQLHVFTNAQQHLIDPVLRIHSLEARHAARMRRLRATHADLNQTAWVSSENAMEGTFLAVVYEGEGQTVQEGRPLASDLDYPAGAIAEAFDEPLSTAKSRAFLDRFVVKPVPL